MQAFHPVDNATAAISASTTTASAEIDKRPTGRFQLRIHNASTALAFYRVGDTDVEAASTDIPLPAGGVEVITVENADADPETHVAAILDSGTGNVYVTTGRGI